VFRKLIFLNVALLVLRGNETVYIIPMKLDV